jgi:hypothetical protein
MAATFERAERFVADLQTELAEAARYQAITAAIIGERRRHDERCTKTRVEQ